MDLQSSIKSYKNNVASKYDFLDSNNSLICFSLSNGQEIWKFQTDKQLIKSQKILNSIFFILTVFVITS